MVQSKLILIEGVPGSGKTTMADFVHDWLDRKGVRNRYHSEGDPAHPADYESVAYLTETEYAAFLHRHLEQRALLARYAEAVDGDRFVYYGQLARDRLGPEALIAELAQRDVYEIENLGTHQRLIRDRWRRFVETTRRGDEVYLFECCFLQNALTIAQLKYDLPHADALRYLHSILDLIRPLDPVLIYLSHREIPASLERVAAERPREWREWVGAYTDRGAWAPANGRAGFEGFVAWLEARQAFELPFVAHSGLSHLVLDVTGQDWRAYQRRVAAFLQQVWMDV